MLPDTLPIRPSPEPAVANSLTAAPATPPMQPLLVDIAALAMLLARSVPALERDQSAGRIPRPLRLGRSKRWALAEIEEWVLAGMPGRREWEVRRRK